MRSEQQMMSLILRVAEDDDRVRAVAMNGSRVNRNAASDIYQDYDIVYLVSEMASFLHDPAWIDVFGKRLIMQTPDAMTLCSTPRDRFAYLMQFMDGNRIDLSLIPMKHAHEYAAEDPLTVILLDKDGCLPTLPPPTDARYRVRPPSAADFADCCNEFWWVVPYVAKGLWRGELLYATAFLDQPMRAMLMKMLEWRVGIETDFSVSVGKCGRHFEQYLAAETWQALLATFAPARYDDTWEALWAACELFRYTARSVAAYFGYTYAESDDTNVTAYVQRIHAQFRRRKA